MSCKTIVLKFGGSVLRDECDLAKAVTEVYRCYRNGYRVLAVVSAFNGATDKLIARADAVCDERCERSLAALLATGEATTAALLSLALRRSGVAATTLKPFQLGLLTEGDGLNDEIRSVDDARLRYELEKAVAVVSGFVGINEKHDLTLLGRGGSDLTALYLADALGAECRLIKDVDGLFDQDPAFFPEAKIYEKARFDTVIAKGGELVQEKAVRFAQSRGLQFEIAALGAEHSTKVGFTSDILIDKDLENAPLRVALLGCGTVGGGVYQRLFNERNRFEISGVVNLDREKALALGIPHELLANDAEDLITRNCDVVVELIGGTEKALDYVSLAIKSGKHVVSANKALFARHGQALKEIADECGTEIRYSAAVGGAVPILETVANTQDIVAVRGIVNGTCNFICGELAKETSFEEAVVLAQKAGFAEADPTTDIDGTDAAQKLKLIIKEAFDLDIPFEEIDREGIVGLNGETVKRSLEDGFATRLIAECRKTDGRIKARVYPALIPIGEDLAAISGADNCVIIETANGEKRTVKGKGAGRWATTESVIADLFDLSRSHRRAYSFDAPAIKYLEAAA